MAERAVRAVKRPQHPPQAYLLQQQRRAARDVPLCAPQLRVVWAAFGIGLASVLLSLCLMIGGAASSNTVYGGKGSTNLTAVYVGIVFLIIGLAALVFFGFRFARVRQLQKSEFIERDTGHDNAAFPASYNGQKIPMNPTPSKFAAPAVTDSPNDSAYSSLALPSNIGSELSARRLHTAQYSQPPRPLPPAAGQYHRVNSQDPQRPPTRPGPSQPPPSSGPAMGRPDGAESRAQRPPPAAYHPARPHPMTGQPGPSSSSQAQRGHLQGPSTSTNRSQMYTEHHSSSNYPGKPNPRSGEQPSTVHPRSGGPGMPNRNPGPSVAVPDPNRLPQVPVARNQHSVVVPVNRHPHLAHEQDAAFHASSSAAVHDPYRRQHNHESRGTGAYDSSSCGTII